MADGAIGIDLGTTHCRVAVWRDGRLEVIPNEVGNLLTPSCVAFVGGERLVGDAAKSQVTREPKATVCSATMLAGCTFSSLAVQRFQKNSLCSVVSTAQGVPAVAVAGRSRALLPTELLAEVLGHARRAAELHLDRAVSRAVLVVPACFDYAQRLAIKAAGELAGLEVLSLVTDTAAAAVAYAFDRTGTTGRRNVLFFDLGGGSLSTTLVTVDGSSVEVKAAAGDPYLGGDDIDSRMVDHFLEEFRLRHSRDLSAHPRAMSRLRVACEAAKRTLSSAAEATIELDFLVDSITFRTSITRAKFETRNGSLFRAVLPPCEAVLREAGLAKTEVHDVVLVGAGSRVPKVQELLAEFFDGKALNRSLDMDTASAQGAAIQAAILTQGSVRNLLLVEGARSTLSVGVADGALYPLVRRNAIIPTVKSVVFTTCNDDQACARIPVYAGDHSLAEKNQLLGVVYMNGIAPASRGVPQIEVTFEVGGDGLLTVLAEESRGPRIKVKATFIHSNGALAIQHTPPSAANPDPSCSTPQHGWLVPYHMRSAGTGAPATPHRSAVSGSQANKSSSAAASPQSFEQTPRRRRLDEVEGSTPLSDLKRSVGREMERRLGNVDADSADSTLPSAFRELWEVLQAAQGGKGWQVSDFSPLRHGVDAVRQQLAAQQESVRTVVASLRSPSDSAQLAALCAAQEARDQARRQLCAVLEAASAELLGCIRMADGGRPTAMGLEAYKEELWKAGTTLFSLLERCCNEAEGRGLGRLNRVQPGPVGVTVEEALQAWEAWRVLSPLHAITLDATVDPTLPFRLWVEEGLKAEWEWNPAAHFPLHTVLGGARGLLARREAEFPAVQAAHQQLAAWQAEKIAVLTTAEAKEGLLRDLQRAREAWEAAAAGLAGMAADYPELAVHVAARYPTPPS